MCPAWIYQGASRALQRISSDSVVTQKEQFQRQLDSLAETIGIEDSERKTLKSSVLHAIDELREGMRCQQGEIDQLKECQIIKPWHLR